MSFQGDLEEEIPESCTTTSDDDLELDETNLGEGNAKHAHTFNLTCAMKLIFGAISLQKMTRRLSPRQSQSQRMETVRP